MLENCKTCLFYDAMYDDICAQYDDDMPLDGSIPDNHFCDMWDDTGEVIPKDVWENKIKCKHYMAK